MKNLLYLLLAISFLSFNGDKDKDRLLSKHLRAQYAYIPSGTLFSGDTKSDIEGFYMMNTEVTNLAYREFLSFLKTNDSEEKAKQYADEIVPNIDDEFQEKYFHHPAYNNFPISNMSYEAAIDYCAFLKKALNRSGGIKKGYKVEHCRIPTKSEWQYAATGGHQLAPYPWGGYYYRNAKGCLLANFNPIGGEVISKDATAGEYQVIQDSMSKYNKYLSPVPVDSYFPNDFGLYNMSGNIAELVVEHVAMGGSYESTGHDIKIDSEVPFQNQAITVGFRPIFNIVPVQKETDE